VRLTNLRETWAFFLARAIVVAAQFAATPVLLAPLYMQLARSGGAALMSAASLGVSLVMWLATLLVFLVLRGGMRGVPAIVAKPGRRADVTTSSGEIGAFIIALLIVMVIFSVLNVLVIVPTYTSLRQSGQVALVVPISLFISAATAAAFYLVFIALRSVMPHAASTEAYGEYGGPDEGDIMGFGRAITTCFRKYAVFDGRARRAEYWFWTLFQILLLIPLMIVDAFAFGTASGAFSGIAILIMFLPGLAVTVRRLHDADLSGWWVLIGPVALVMACLRGTGGPNRFGPDPIGHAAIPEVFA
jgi:uncharacterized membrane protein YhaH (DUF805 family)